MTEPFYALSTPVFTVAGTLEGALARDLVRLDVEETTAGLKHLHARFHARGPDPDGGSEEEILLYLDGRVLDFGRDIRVEIGPLGDQHLAFDGRISALAASYDEGQAPEVMIDAEDKLMDLRMTRRMRHYEFMTDADIAGAIAAEHGLGTDLDLDGPTHDRIQQWNMSDLAFLRERARLLQAEVWVADDTLHFKARDRRDGPEFTLIRGRDLVAAEVRADLAEQRTAVHVTGYDAAARGRIDEQAGVDAVDAEITGGRSGPAVLDEAFGERVSYRVREVPLVAAEAADWARAEQLRRSRRFLTLRGVTNGTPRMAVGCRLTLERLGAPFDGEGWYVTRVRQSWDLGSGHRTRFEAERAALGVRQ